MLIAALRDLQWRRRRFFIAAGGTALVFAITLILTGLSNGFTQENRATMRSLGVDSWVVADGAFGPFSGKPIPAAVAADVARTPGVTQAVPLVFAVTAVSNPPRDVTVFGAPVGGPGIPVPSDGRRPQRDGEVLASTRLDYSIGDRLTVNGVPLNVVGLAEASTAIAGHPNMFVTLGDAQKLLYSGQPIATVIAVRGVPQSAPPGLKVLPQSAGMSDLQRPIEKPRQAINAIALLLWIVAAAIVGSTIYISTLERMRDFAVFKAIGVRTRDIFAGIALQAVIISLIAALLGLGLALLAAPRFPMLVEIASTAIFALPALAVGTGLAASLFVLRRTATVEPALAFGGR